MSKIHAMSEFEQLKHALHISTMSVNNTDNKDNNQIPVKISENTITCSTNATQKRKE